MTIVKMMSTSKGGRKGGRTERVYARINPEVKKRLVELCAERKITVADFIESAVNIGYEAEDKKRSK